MPNKKAILSYSWDFEVDDHLIGRLKDRFPQFEFVVIEHLSHNPDILRHARTMSDIPEFVDELFTVRQMNDVFSRSDFIVAALPHTAETTRIITAEHFNHVKKGAVFINVGRGPTVDEQALIRALQEGALEGAGLDVTEIEPLPESSPLWEMPNVIIPSHSIGVIPHRTERRFELLINNLDRFAKGERMINVINRKAGY